VFFFFSSRRRHTRLQGDWSSDVCSSDLTHAVQPSAVVAMVGPTTPLVVLNAVPSAVVYFTESAKYASSAVTRLRRSDFIDARYRSEERRVGKEGRSTRVADESKRKQSV